MLSKRPRTKEYNRDLIIALSAGIFLGYAIIGTIFEALDTISWFTAGLWLLIGFVGWLIFHRLLKFWHAQHMSILIGLIFWVHVNLDGNLLGIYLRGLTDLPLSMLLMALAHSFVEYFSAWMLLVNIEPSKSFTNRLIMIGVAVLLANLLVTYTAPVRIDLNQPQYHLLIAGALLYVGSVNWWGVRRHASLYTFLFGVFLTGIMHLTLGIMNAMDFSLLAAGGGSFFSRRRT